MPINIGTIELNRHTVTKDEVIYARAGNSVTHVDTVAARRTLGKPQSPELRTSLRFDRGFVPTNVNDTVEKPVTVSIAVTVRPGLSETDVKAYIVEALTQSAQTAASMAWTGDVYLGD